MHTQAEIVFTQKKPYRHAHFIFERHNDSQSIHSRQSYDTLVGIWYALLDLNSHDFILEYI